MLRLAIFVVISLAIATYGRSAEPNVANGQSARSWIKNLSHDSPRARAAAARALAEIGGEEAIGPLAERLTDSDSDVRLQAAYALGRINKRPEQTILALSRLLRDADEHVRYSAQWSLGQIAQGFLRPENREAKDAQPVGKLLWAAADVMAQTGAPESIQRRVREASDFALNIRTAKAEPLGQPTEDLQALIADLKATDVYVQVQALAKVKRIDPAAVPELMKILAPICSESILEWELPEALAELGLAIVPTLVQSLESDDEAIRNLAINVLVEMKTNAQGALPQLNKILADKDVGEDYLMKAILAISNLGPAAKESTGLLAKIVADSEQTELIRTEATRTIGEIGPEASGAIPTLKRLLRRGEEQNELRIEAAEAIAKTSLHGEEAARLIIELIEETDDVSLAAGLATKLATLKANAAAGVPILVRLIGQTEVELYQRQEMVLALGEIGPGAPTAIPMLVGLLTNPAEDSSVQVAAALTISKLGPAAVSALAEQSRSPNSTTRLTVARALVAIGTEATPAVDSLLQTLGNPKEEGETRVLAAIALGKIGKPAKPAIPTLTRLLHDSANDDDLRAMCVVAAYSIDPTHVFEIDSSSKALMIASEYAASKTPEPGSKVWVPSIVGSLIDEEVAELATRALIDIGEPVVPQLAMGVLDSECPIDLRLACIRVLGQMGQSAATPLLAAMNNEKLAEAAQEALQCLDDEVVSQLLIAAEDEDRYTSDARERIKAVVRYFHDGLGAGGDDLSWGQAHPLSRRPDESSTPGAGSGQAIRLGPPIAVMGKPADVLTAEGFKTVKVYYGTNRKPANSAPAASQFFSLQKVALVALAVCLICFLCQTPKNGLAILASGIGLVVVAAPQLLPLGRIQTPLEAASGPVYGGEYSQNVEMGVCDVTLPNIHEVGELEGPSVLHLEIKVDPEKHIVLSSVRRLERDAFFNDLEEEMGQRGRNVLVFVHGYNVSFEDAARRTAQMASDLKFPGAAAFYSWPSQAHWYKYRLDEKNVELSVEQLKSFLLAVAERSQADTINLVAHSMGNRVLTGALKEIDASARNSGMLFNQVVLAAPDIDAAIFKTRIAPAIVTKAHRITLYASSKDLALYASRQFNSGDPRAGDAGEDVVVVPGIETIDASAGDCSLLGHCYYGDSVSILHDIERLLQDQPAQARPFLHPVDRAGTTYWMFEPNEVASRPGSVEIVR